MLSVLRWCRGPRARISLMCREKEKEKEREKERSRMAEARPRAHAHAPLLRPVPHPAPPSSPAAWLKPHPASSLGSAVRWRCLAPQVVCCATGLCYVLHSV